MHARAKFNYRSWNSPVEQIEHFRPLDEPERVLGVRLPHEQVLDEVLVILVRALHVEVRKQLHQPPACLAFLECQINVLGIHWLGQISTDLRLESH